MTRRIVVAYAGVHQAFEIALAAQEIDELETFYCSLYDGPGKWGNIIAKAIGHDSLSSRHIDGLDETRAAEFPWPLMRKLIRDKLGSRRRDDWLATYEAFDRWVGRRLERSSAEIFVGTGGCDLHSLISAQRMGMTRVHDCPQLHQLFLRKLLREAADKAGIKTESAPVQLNKWESRTLQEYSHANVLLVYSDIHKKSFEAGGYPPERLFMAPLWVDTKRWRRNGALSEEADPTQPLRLLFVGSISLRKGIPFLIKSVVECGAAVRLTVVGSIGPGMEALLKEDHNNIKFMPPQRKSKLRDIYSSHDVLVLPSVADSFGFVGLEAMACGLPVIVTQNTGVPVPDCSWRVPTMDSQALAQRIMKYAEDRTLVAQHGNVAVEFASNYGPEKYRHNIGMLFKSLLNSRRLS